MTSTTDKAITESPCPFPLPITKDVFDHIITSLKEEVAKQYTEQREKFVDSTLGSTAEQRKARSQKDIDADFAKLRKANPVLAGPDALKAPWLPTRGDVPPFPLREMAASASPHALEPKEGLRIDVFMQENDRLLAMTQDELKAVPYLEGWMFKFALTRYFDFPSAATRFLRMREVFHKHNLTFTFSNKFTEVYNGGFNVSRMFAENTTNPNFVLPPVPESELQEPATEEARKLRAAHPYRTHKTPILIARARYNDFSKFSIEIFKKAWFYFIASVAASDYYEQTHGHVLMMSGKDSGMANMSREFANFASEAIQTAMPIKVQRMFMCHQGWFFNNIVSPLMSLLLSKKMRSKMVVTSDPKCKEVLLECGPERIPAEFGGTMELVDNGDEVRKWIFTIMGKEYKPEKEEKE